MINFLLRGNFITLGQFLKEIGEIGTGGAAKWYLQEEEIKVNDELETRRGRKLYVGDRVQLNTGTSYLIIEK